MKFRVHLGFYIFKRKLTVSFYQQEERSPEEQPQIERARGSVAEKICTNYHRDTHLRKRV